MTMLLRLLAAVVLLAASVTAQAQPAAKVYRIGWLGTAIQTAPEAQRLWGPFYQRLSELGYVEGKNTVIERRYSEGKLERFPGLAEELVRHNVDVIVAVGVPAAQAAQKATRIIPIVMAGVADPVGAGLVASLARPGANVTGVSNLSAGLAGKRLELLKQVVPEVSSVGVLWNPANRGSALQLEQAKVAAQALGVALRPLEVHGPQDIERAFQTATQGRTDALMGLDDPVIFSQRARIVALAEKGRLPAIYGIVGFPEAGGLMSYGTNFPEHFREAATYIDKILKGAKPADLPIEQPTKFELVINLKTARALGLKVPQSLLLRADHVIE